MTNFSSQHRGHSEPAAAICPHFTRRESNTLDLNCAIYASVRLLGQGKPHLQVETCIRLGEGISQKFHPMVYWRPDRVGENWARWERRPRPNRVAGWRCWISNFVPVPPRRKRHLPQTSGRRVTPPIPNLACATCAVADLHFQHWEDIAAHILPAIRS